MLRQKVQNNRRLGATYEVLATQYLLQKGYEILENNYRCGLGEIDIIAKQGTYVVFLEVKYKRQSQYGYPRESVTYSKQRRIMKAAVHYLTFTRQYGEPCRFDVIEILESKITHIENAFM